MGLIQAALAAGSSTLADQWKEFFYCESMPPNVLMTRGVKQRRGLSSNRGNDNIITSGSGIAVADGQCMIIVENGAIVEFCAEPGTYTFDASTEPSIFYGKLDQGIIATWETFKKRFVYGGDTGKDQRIYYFNTKELIDNKFGTPTPIPFRVVDTNANLDMDFAIRVSGIYSYRIADPLLFYKNVAGNVSGTYYREELDAQMKTEFVSALPKAFAKISDLGIRPNQLQAHTDDIEAAMNEQLSQEWSQTRGIKIVSVALNPVTLTEEDAQMLKDAQKAAILKDQNMAAARTAEAYAKALENASSNPNGAMMGFMGMGMAQNAGAPTVAAMYQMAQGQQVPQQAPVQETWTCPNCGTANTGKFCMECGFKKPE